jgi:hypothetical protein
MIWDNSYGWEDPISRDIMYVNEMSIEHIKESLIFCESQFLITSKDGIKISDWIHIFKAEIKRRNTNIKLYKHLTQ